MTAYPRVFVLGDSVTVGRDASTPLNAYPHLVIAGLIARGAANATAPGVYGIGGWTAGQMLATLQALALAPQADALVVELGTNDFVHNTPLGQFQADYANLTNYLCAAHVPACLVLLTPWSDPVSVNGLGVACNQYTSAIQSQAQALAQQHTSMTVAAVDLGPLFTTPANHPINTAVDLFHLSDWGHQAVASAVLATIPA